MQIPIFCSSLTVLLRLNTICFTAGTISGLLPSLQNTAAANRPSTHIPALPLPLNISDRELDPRLSLSPSPPSFLEEAFRCCRLFSTWKSVCQETRPSQCSYCHSLMLIWVKESFPQHALIGFLLRTHTHRHTHL